MMMNRLIIKSSDWQSVHYIITSDNGVQCAFAPQVHTDQRDVPIIQGHPSELAKSMTIL